MSKKESLCISYFDNIIGPNIFYCNEDLSKKSDSPDLGRLLDFSEEESTFILAIKDFQTLNHVFFIENTYSRGGKDIFMVSFLIQGDSFKDKISDIFYFLNSKKPILLDFAKELTQLEELPKIITKNKKLNLLSDVNTLGSSKFQEKFDTLFANTYEQLTTKTNINSIASTDPIKKLFILGANQTENNNFLEQVELIQSNLKKSTDLSTKIFEVILENMEKLRKECFDDLLKCKQCEINNRCITQAQGFIIIFDNTNMDSVIQARERYNIIVRKLYKFKPNKPIPILLIGNTYRNMISDIPNSLLDEVLNEGEEKTTEEGYIIKKYVELDLENDRNSLQESFRWIIKQMI